MSPRCPPRTSKANNETTPRKTRSNGAGSKTPIENKFHRMSITSPSHKIHSSPISGSDKENYRDEENFGKKGKSNLSAKKKLPFGISNQENIIEDDTSIASRTRTRTSATRTPCKTSQPTLSSPQKRLYCDSDTDPNDEDYKCKNSPKKRISLSKKSSQRLAAKMPVDFEENEEVQDIENKSPRKMTLRNSSSRSTTPQRRPVVRVKAAVEKKKNEDVDSSDEYSGSEDESESSAESVSSTDTNTNRKKKVSQKKKHQVETFEEEPEISEINLLLGPVTKLELEVMREDTARRAETRRKRESNPLMQAYPLFHTSALPDVLLKREEQCKEIEHFIKQAVAPNSSVHNRSIYISGVPGTGKTACVTKVVQKLQSQKKSIKFNYVYVNGLELVKPQHVFSEIYNSLYPSTRPAASKTARDKLSKIFNFNDSKRNSILLVVDELDMLCTKSQDVVYDIFDWASTEEARLTVIGIANTLDLPERVLKQRVSSRLGYNRLTFQPYNFEEITDILEYRIRKSGISYKSNAFGLISRKVAAVSGDLRKALELIRRSIEIAVDNEDEMLTLQHAQAAVKEGLQSLPSLFTKSLSLHQEYLLRSIVQENRATSFEELDFILIYDCYRRNCLASAKEPLEMCATTGLLSSLKAMGYIDIKAFGLVSRRITFKTSVDEIENLLKQIKINASEL